MSIRKELLSKIISEAIINCPDFTDINFNLEAEKSSLLALSEIQKIVKNDELSDYDAIEEIIDIFEKYNLDSGNRHDW